MELGIAVWPRTWIELAWIWPSSNFRPTRDMFTTVWPPRSTRANNRQVVLLLLSDSAVAVRQLDGFLASWLDSVPFGHSCRSKLWFCNLAQVGSTVWPKPYTNRFLTARAELSAKKGKSRIVLRCRLARRALENRLDILIAVFGRASVSRPACSHGCRGHMVPQPRYWARRFWGAAPKLHSDLHLFTRDITSRRRVLSNMRSSTFSRELSNMFWQLKLPFMCDNAWYSILPNHLREPPFTCDIAWACVWSVHSSIDFAT